MSQLPFGNGGVGLQWRVATNILNNHSRTSNKQWSSSLVIVNGANNIEQSERITNVARGPQAWRYVCVFFWATIDFSRRFCQTRLYAERCIWKICTPNGSCSYTAAVSQQAVKLNNMTVASVVQCLACLPLDPRFAGSYTAETIYFTDDKNPQHASSECKQSRRPHVVRFYGMLKELFGVWTKVFRRPNL